MPQKLREVLRQKTEETRVTHHVLRQNCLGHFEKGHEDLLRLLDLRGRSDEHLWAMEDDMMHQGIAPNLELPKTSHRATDSGPPPHRAPVAISGSRLGCGLVESRDRTGEPRVSEML